MRSCSLSNALRGKGGITCDARRHLEDNKVLGLAVVLRRRYGVSGISEKGCPDLNCACVLFGHTVLVL